MDGGIRILPEGLFILIGAASEAVVNAFYSLLEKPQSQLHRYSAYSL